MASVKDAISDFSWTPATPPESKFDTRHQPNVTGSKIHRTIALSHFTHAINEVYPSSSKDSHSELRRWHDRFGNKRTFDDRDGELQTNGLLPGKGSGGFKHASGTSVDGYSGDANVGGYKGGAYGHKGDADTTDAQETVNELRARLGLQITT